MAFFSIHLTLSLLFFSIQGSNPLFYAGEEHHQRMDCVLELPLLSLDLASPAQLSPRAPDLATTGLTSSSRAQAGQGNPPMEVAASPSRSVHRRIHARSIWIRHADMDGRLGAPLCRPLIWASGRPPVLRIRQTTSPPTQFRQTPQPPSTTCAKHAPSSRGGHAPRPAAAHLLCQSAQPPRPGLLRPQLQGLVPAFSAPSSRPQTTRSLEIAGPPSSEAAGGSVRSGGEGRRSGEG
ncbi:uncharacterized protein LOC119267751 [Triticum dicoccoides]|uniref:uncharacterized protein LOC119267751 n=1 Tax=Triticum dicoccoides TaxID=85692 RepID=UPI0008454013|nr:uncharacterized protein LOC119267751 [Triticum dicoccoides]XP_044339663.1 uncharacterized protein LOC123060865 [Triticum aestivum]